MSVYDSDMTDADYEELQILDDLSFDIKEQYSSVRFICFGKENEFLHKFIDAFCSS